MKCIQFYLALIFNEIIYNVCLFLSYTCIGLVLNLFTKPGVEQCFGSIDQDQNFMPAVQTLLTLVGLGSQFETLEGSKVMKRESCVEKSTLKQIGQSLCWLVPS